MAGANVQPNHLSISLKPRMLIALPFSHNHSFVANNPAPEKACSASTDVGGMLNN